MTNYQVTIGYRAVISISVMADNEDEARIKAKEIFEKEKQKLVNSSKINIEDNRFEADGVLNMDETWKMLY